MGKTLPIVLEDFPDKLQAPGASFVTLNKSGRLRGCIGALEAYQPLIKDVTEHAYAAAFQDPRFAPLTEIEFPDIEVQVSVLSVPEPVYFDSEAHLLEQIRVGIDGLILAEGSRRGTFLPSVWDTLSEPGEFLRQLKRKAGLEDNHWSESIKVYRYTTESIS